MLKTIRNRIVGMMKTLRIVMSLQPRVAAREAGLSVVITAVAKASFLHALEKKKEGAVGAPSVVRSNYWPRPYFLKVAVQSAASASSVSLAVPASPVT